MPNATRPAPSERSTAAPRPDVPIRGGEMGARVHALDWAATPLGPMESWPQSLKATVRTLLASRYPMVLTWGSSFTQIYNDGYSALIGDKHPGALGDDIRVTLAESWDILGPMIARVMETGVANWTPALPLLLNRAGYREESYFSVSHAPAEDDEGRTVGMLAVCSEVTEQVLGDRRLRLLRDLAAGAAETRTVEATGRDIAAALAGHPLDLPFAALYLHDRADGRLRRAFAVGLDEAAAPQELSATDEAWDEAWPMARALEGEAVSACVPAAVAVQGGFWGDPVTDALLLPIASATPDAPLGVLIAGLSPSRALDEGYRSFFELLAAQISVSLRNALAHEDERRRAEALTEIDRAKTRFFSNVSHEFRTPLALMLGPLENALADPQGLPPERRDDLAIAHRNGRRLLRLVNTLLDFSRVEAGRADAAFRPTDLATLTAELAGHFRSACERAGLALKVDCPPLPQPVHVDRELWEQIVLNLLSNAFKFTLEGGIAVTLRATPDGARLTVRDTGSGIPESELPRLFERFHRIEGARGRSIEGSGIGLALVNDLVRLHGGTVGVESAVGQGSAFHVTLSFGASHLPAERVRPPAAELAEPSASLRAAVDEALLWLPEDEAADAPAGPAGGDRPRVLLADDNADMRSYVSRLLGNAYAVEAVADGAAALASARADPPDLVISDIMMPELPGDALLAALRADPATQGVPVILLSARAGPEARAEGLAAGADDYLVKPFGARELLARVGGALSLAALRRDAALRDSELAVAMQTALAARDLQESERKLRLAVEATELGLWDFEVATGRLVWSAQLSALYGLPQDTPITFDDFKALLHPDDRNTLLSAFEAALDPAGSGRFGLEHRIVTPAGEIRWLLGAAQVLFEDGRPVRAIGTARDITPRKRREERLRVSEERYRLATSAFRGAVYEYDAATGLFDRSPAAHALIGEPPGSLAPHAESWLARIHADDIAAVRATIATVYESDADAFEMEYRVRHRDGRWIWIWQRAMALRDEVHRLRRVVGSLVDITDRKEAEAHLRLLLDELNHRVKNTLATVQSIAAQTLRTAESPRTFYSGFEGRLLALSQTHNLLTEGRWQGASLRALLDKELEPYRSEHGGRYELDGADLELGPRHTVSLGLAFHELATNAAKYGALSASGRVSVRWRVAHEDGQRRLKLEWAETGGPAVAKPARRGFGSRLIERGIRAELEGRVRLDFAPEGLYCALDVPLPGGDPPDLPDAPPTGDGPDPEHRLP